MIALLLAFACAGAQPDGRHVGLCETSGAWRGDRGGLWVIDDEEGGTLLSLGADGGVQRHALGVALDDLEGAAADGSGVWLVTSHSIGKKGGPPKPARQLLVRLDADRTPLWHRPLPLREPGVLDGLLSGGSGLPSAWLTGRSKHGGLDIEGLAIAQGHLWLGLRGPLTTDGEAVVVEVEADQGLRPVAAHRLPLGERGIRSLAHFRSGFLLIAGPSGSGSEDFVLVQWLPGTPPVVLRTLDVPEHTAPEALVVLPDGLWIGLDEGARIKAEGGGSEPCSAQPAERGWARSLRLPLPG
jgi:hypothetical protein